MNTCYQCGHEITKLGNNWMCVERCRCLIAGCVLDRGPEFKERTMARVKGSNHGKASP